MQSPHDHLFHYTFGHPEHAADLLRGALPRHLADPIDWRTLTRCDAKLTDGETDSLHADLLFEVRIHERPAYLFVLLEHKSEIDPDTAFQLLRYIVRIWERHAREHPGTALPPILTVVLHHGRTPWRGARSLRDLIDVESLPADLALGILAAQPQLAFVLHDLATLTQAEILERVSLLLPRLSLLCLQFLRDAPADEAEAALRGWRDLLRALYGADDAHDAFLQLVAYIAIITNSRPERVRRIFAEVHPDAEQIYMKYYGQPLKEAMQEGIAIGKVQGKAEGKAEGEAEGRAELLLRLLTVRFGPPTDATAARVHAASPSEIELWAVAVLSAPTLAAVFAAG